MEPINIFVFLILISLCIYAFWATFIGYSPEGNFNLGNFKNNVKEFSKYKCKNDIILRLKQLAQFRSVRIVWPVIFIASLFMTPIILISLNNPLTIKNYTICAILLFLLLLMEEIFRKAHIYRSNNEEVSYLYFLSHQMNS